MDDQNSNKESVTNTFVNLYLPMLLAGILLFALIFSNGGCVPR